LAVVRYKSGKDTDGNVVPPKFANVCTSVPFVAVSSIIEAIDKLAPHIVSWVQDKQDDLIKSLYEAQEGSMSLVTDSDISIDSILGYLEAESTGGRLTKEFIGAWFDSACADAAYILFCDVLKYSGNLTVEQENRVQASIKGYKDMYCALAGGKTMYQPNQIKNLQKVLALVDSDDTHQKLTKRLESLANPKKSEEMLDLGD
jgi:hypothetical protein